MSGHFHPYNKTKLDKWKINNFSWTYERTEVTEQTTSPQTAEITASRGTQLLFPFQEGDSHTCGAFTSRNSVQFSQ